MKRPPLKVIFLLCAVMAAAAFLVIYYTGKNREGAVFHVTGIIDGVEVNLSPKVAGRISWTCCNEGDAVAADQVAVTLESEDLKASVDQAAAVFERAKADILTAKASIDNARSNIIGAEADMKSAAADVERARAQKEEAQREAERAKELFKKEFISRESRDQIVSTYEVNTAAFDSSKEKLNAARSRRDAASSQLAAAESQLASSKAMQKEAEAALAFSRAKLADTIIRTPVAGVVIFKSMEAGETVSPGVTIMTIVDLQSRYARVDLDESKIGGIVLQGAATVTAEGLPGRVFNGKISEIGRYAEFATQRDVVRGREDIKTFRVKVRVDDPEGLLKPGMTVEVAIPRKG